MTYRPKKLMCKQHGNLHAMIELKDIALTELAGPYLASITPVTDWQIW
jgi:hypothetical protein